MTEQEIQNLQNADDNNLPEQKIAPTATSGYLSKEQWAAAGKAEEEYLTEEEYNKFGKKFKTVLHEMHGLKKQIRERDDTLQHLAVKFNTIKAVERKKIEDEYQKQFAQALQDGNADKAAQLQKDWNNVAYKHQQEQAEEQIQQQKVQQIQNIPPAARDFLDRNPDIAQDPLLLRQAELTERQIIKEYEQRGQYLNQYDILQEVERRMRNQQGQNSSASIRSSIDRLNPMAPSSATNKVVSNNSQAKLSDEDRADFEALRTMYKNKGETYTVERFLKSKARLNANRVI